MLEQITLKIRFAKTAHFKMEQSDNTHSKKYLIKISKGLALSIATHFMLSEKKQSKY